MRPTMKATQTDRAVVFTGEFGDAVRVRCWDNGGVLTLDISFAEGNAVAVEVNGREVVECR